MLALVAVVALEVDVEELVGYGRIATESEQGARGQEPDAEQQKVGLLGLE